MPERLTDFEDWTDEEIDIYHKLFDAALKGITTCTQTEPWNGINTGGITYHPDIDADSICIHCGLDTEHID